MCGLPLHLHVCNIFGYHDHYRQKNRQCIEYWYSSASLDFRWAWLTSNTYFAFGLTLLGF